jgi:hypothetical protein
MERLEEKSASPQSGPRDVDYFLKASFARSR